VVAEDGRVRPCERLEGEAEGLLVVVDAASSARQEWEGPWIGFEWRRERGRHRQWKRPRGGKEAPAGRGRGGLDKQFTGEVGEQSCTGWMPRC
jgi:hypothetical protein